MKIGELVAITGIPASTIRYWERIGIFPSPVRLGGQRRYSADAVHLLAVLRLAQACSFTLKEMRDLLHGFAPGFKASGRWQSLAQAKQTELNGQIRQLRAMRRLVGLVQQCDCTELTDCGRIATSAMKADSK